MSDFKQTIDKLIDVEGGYVNHPNDKGGPTKYGITLNTLKSWRGKSVTATDVMNLTKSEAIEIYKAKYWDINRTSEIKQQLIANILFDQAVNRGYKTAAMMLQEACNKLGSKLGIDGKIGNLSLQAINSYDDIPLAIEIIKVAQHDYVDICKRKPSQLVFISGWLNRTHKLLDETIGYVNTEGEPLPKPKDVDTGGLIEKIVDLIMGFFGDSKPIDEKKEESLSEKIFSKNPELPKAGLVRALSFLDHDKVKIKDRFGFVDFDKHSSKERFYIISTKDGSIIELIKTAHGKYSDGDNDGYADRYSNVPGSGQSSLGAMVTGDEYGKATGGWSKFDYSVKLHGLEIGLNDNVYERAVVIHTSAYVHEDNDSKSGRSLGCFAFDDALGRHINDLIKGGMLIYSYDKDFIK